MTLIVLQSSQETSGAMVYCNQCRRYRKLKPDGTCADCGCKIVHEDKTVKGQKKGR